MKLKLRHAIAALLVVLAGCTGTTPTATPTAPAPQRSKITATLESATKYEIDAHINNSVHNQKIALGIGRAMSPAEFSKNRQLCKGLDPRDVVIPFLLLVTNTSAPGTPATNIGTNFTPAGDATLFQSDGIQVQIDDEKSCIHAYPAKGATTMQLIDGTQTKVGSITAYSPAAVGETIIWQGAYVLGVNKTTGITSPPESVFLRLTAPGPKKPGDYTVTKLVKVGNGRDGGVITSGPDAGTYYIPLGDTTPCAKSFAGDVPMTCGAKLQLGTI